MKANVKEETQYKTLTGKRGMIKMSKIHVHDQRQRAGKAGLTHA